MLLANSRQRGDERTVQLTVLEQGVRAVVTGGLHRVVGKVLTRSGAASAAHSSQQVHHLRVRHVQERVDQRLGLQTRVLSASIQREKQLVRRVGSGLAEEARFDGGSCVEVVALREVHPAVAFEKAANV